jgi:dimeric dUTPase (all-alpha-NTP-PPase superfamily)
MRNPNDEYDRLHDHMTAIARERDWANQEIERLKLELNLVINQMSKTLHDVRDELELAHEALRRQMP